VESTYKKREVPDGWVEHTDPDVNRGRPHWIDRSGKTHCTLPWDITAEGTNAAPTENAVTAAKQAAVERTKDLEKQQTINSEDKVRKTLQKDSKATYEAAMKEVEKQLQSDPLQGVPPEFTHAARKTKEQIEECIANFEQRQKTVLDKIASTRPTRSSDYEYYTEYQREKETAETELANHQAKVAGDLLALLSELELARSQAIEEAALAKEREIAQQHENERLRKIEEDLETQRAEAEEKRRQEETRIANEKTGRGELKGFFQSIKQKTQNSKKMPSKDAPWTFRVLVRKKKSVVTKKCWYIPKVFNLIGNVVNGWSVSKMSRGCRIIEMYYDDGYIHLIIYNDKDKFNIHVIVKNIMTSSGTYNSGLGRVRFVLKRVPDPRENYFWSTNKWANACDRHVYTRSKERPEEAKNGMDLVKSIWRIHRIINAAKKAGYNDLNFNTRFHDASGNTEQLEGFKNLLLKTGKVEPVKKTSEQQKLLDTPPKLPHVVWDELVDKVSQSFTDWAHENDASCLKHLEVVTEQFRRRRLNEDSDYAARALRHHLRRRLKPVPQPGDSPGIRVLRRRRLKPENRPIHRLLREIREANGLPREPPELPELEWSL